MSLNYNYSAVPEQYTVSPFDKDRIHPVTNYLIWSSLLTGVGSITKSNYQEVYRRVAVLQKLNGSDIQYLDPLTKDLVSIYVTLDDIKNHIGLWTNASTMTPSQFDKHIMERLSRDAILSYDCTSADTRITEMHERFLTAEQTKVA